MNSQMERTHEAHGHHYDQDPLHPQTTVGGEGEHHEKQSVMKKVKAKAKKIKNSLGIKSHGHDHDQDRDTTNEPAYDNDEDEEYEEEEDELVQDPEIHGAPMYESAAAKNAVSGLEGSGVQPRDNLGTKPHIGQGLDQNVCPGTFQTKVTDPDVPVTPKKFDADSGQFKGTTGQLFGKDYNTEKHERQDVSPTNYQTSGSHFGKADESAAPRNYTDQGDRPGEFKVTTGKHFDADHNAPRNRPGDVSPANYETKAINPAGAGVKEAGVTPVLKSFEKMGIYDEPQHKKDSMTTGSHDQFSPISDRSTTKGSAIPENAPVSESFMANTETPTSDRFSNKSGTNPENPSVPESFNASTEYPQDMNVESFNANTEKYPQDMNVDEPAKQQSGYISSVTSAAISAKNAVASKIGYGATNDSGSGSQMNKQDHDVASDGSPIASTESVREPVAPQSSYTDKISSATSAITGTAVSAKNVVASKLGYGGNTPTSPTASEMNKGNPTSPTASEMSRGGENAQPGGGVTGYGRQIASTVTGTLAPVYGKVAGVGSAVVSKLPGTGTNKNAATDSDTIANTGSDMDRGTGVPIDTGNGVGGTTDKGVGVKGYISEKLKPGEEDKALSDVISGAFHKPGKGVADEEEKKTTGRVVSDALHKRNDDDETERDNKPMGIVTESEEVANRLGSTESEKHGYVSESQSPGGTGVVDKVKGAFTNWFGKGGETNPSQAFNDHSASHDATGEQDVSTLGGNNESRDGERRLHESTN